MANLTANEYRNDIRPNWCPGCGHFGIHAAICSAAAKRGIEPNKMMVVSGIGCSSRIGGYFYTYGAHTTHGRALPFAQGIKLANQDLDVIACSGDGDAYAIGLGHTVHAIRRNVNLTYIVFDNHIYGLTKGQTSPRTDHGFVTKSSPFGNFEMPLSAIELAIAAGATFVGQEYCMNQASLSDLLVKAMDHKGFSIVNVFSPCVTYNKQNTAAWFKENLVSLSDVEPGYVPHDRTKAISTVMKYSGLCTGLIYEDLQKPAFDDSFPHDRALVNDVVKPDVSIFNGLLNEFKY
jgi:2-oxoglutarate ferredoxin oxidoreductase subunit beta